MMKLLKRSPTSRCTMAVHYVSLPHIIQESTRSLAKLIRLVTVAISFIHLLFTPLDFISKDHSPRQKKSKISTADILVKRQSCRWNPIGTHVLSPMLASSWSYAKYRPPTSQPKFEYSLRVLKIRHSKGALFPQNNYNDIACACA